MVLERPAVIQSVLGSTLREAEGLHGCFGTDGFIRIAGYLFTLGIEALSWE